MKKPSARELPLVKRRVEALLVKTEANGCTPGEAAAALEKAEELVAKYRLDPGSFRWPQRPSTTFGSATSAPKPSKPPRTTTSSRGRGIGKLAEQLIVEHPDWTYRRIAEEVNARIEGSKASEKSSAGTRARCGWTANGCRTDQDAHQNLINLLIGSDYIVGCLIDKFGRADRRPQQLPV